MEEKKSVWLTYSDEEKSQLEKISAGYIDFISNCKTERESVSEAIRQAEEKGYIDFKSVIRSGAKLQMGDKVYYNFMDKAIVLFNIGFLPMSQGLTILGAHIDTCRLDVKQNPLYEDTGLGYLDTHYYGGIKKYQWVALPLAMHGVVVKKDGNVLKINIGEKPEDQVFCVTDLLPHLAQEQLKKDGTKLIEGEKLDILVGNYPIDKALDDKDAKESVENAIIKVLKEKYDIEPEDFLSAELALVPAGHARELGFDRSMVLGYGQDDRVCSYASLIAMLDTPKVDKTAVCLLVDKEEIGSYGASGMKSHFFENVLAEVMDALGDYSELKLRRALQNSNMLSSDVAAGYDPLYSSAFDKKNAAHLGKGMVFNKFTGSRGKAGSSEASAEFVGKIRGILDKNNVRYQFSELGKVDVGGGGTIAYIMAEYGMNVIDSGVAVLSMHSPWEVTSKVDIYETYKGYVAFLKEA